MIETGKAKFRVTRSACLFAVVSLANIGAVAGATLNEHCVVSVLNRTVQVKPDGTWVLPNIPANFGPVRARATCVDNGVTQSGQSDFFTVPTNGSVNVPPIVLGPVTPIPSQVTVTAPTTTLTQAGQTVQLAVTARYADGSTRDIAGGATGTQYLISNPRLATISPDGLVTARESGTVIVQAINEGTQGLLRLSIALSRDSDGDGIPDDVELREGLDPNNPADALDDLDRDGLTNRQELEYGTGLRNPDSDGDGIPDGEEVIAGRDGFITNALLADTDGDGVPDNVEVASESDPTNAASTNLARALSRIRVSPAGFVINVNTVDLQAFQQLTVTGDFTLGGSINLTARARGTNYTSSNLPVCNFGAEDGRVYGGSDGACTITVTNNGFTATASGAVRTFTPVALSYVSIPGFANNVDVSGNYAYVAAGAAGLQVVDVTNRSNPHVVAALDTPGNANDVVVVGNYAYVADGTFGLQIVEITNPLAPVLAGSLDTAGTAWDLVVRGGQAFVADGGAGLAIIDVGDPANASLVGSLALGGTTKGVDADLTSGLAVVGGTAGVRVIDIGNRASPVLLGTAAGGDVRDLALADDYVFVADYARSFTVVDIADPAAPAVRASTNLTLGGRLQDVARSGSLALGADVYFVNGVPIIDIGFPESPQPRSILNFSQYRDDNATGIAVDGSFVYLTAERGISENGAVGDTRLYIGQYRALDDDAGVPPTVSITSPFDGDTVIQGQQLPIAAQANDDVAVAAVSFSVGGVTVLTDTTAPYETTYTVPSTATSLIIEATAIDLGGNVATAEPVQVTAIPDPLTTVIGRVVDEAAAPRDGAEVVCGQLSTNSNADGRFAIAAMATVAGPIDCTATVVDANGDTLSGTSQRVPPVPGGATDVGDLVVSSSRFETELGTNLNLPDDTSSYVAFSGGFAFPLYGIPYAGVHVSSNGRLTFNFGDGTWTENLTDFAEQPQVSAFFDDLYPPSGGTGHGVYVNQLADRFVATWYRVAHYSYGGSNTIQAVLFRDGRIQIGYNGVSATQTGAIVGVAPGTGAAGRQVDFTAEVPLTISANQGVYEWFGVFDLDAKFLIFVPSGSGGYSLIVKPLQGAAAN